MLIILYNQVTFMTDSFKNDKKKNIYIYIFHMKKAAFFQLFS